MKSPEIIYLSPPMPVSMGDSWFEIASPEHFWVIRRFEVLQKLAGDLIGKASCIGEIGCGNGVVQLQVERFYKTPVDGFDLNELALKMSVAETSPRFCYNILERQPDLRGRYDLIFLFDIIEHIDQEDEFIQAVLHHLAPGGHLIINVPALPSLFSAYDRAAGHLRRYTADALAKVAERNGLTSHSVTYWGLPMVPLLFVRKLILAAKKRTDAEILHQGFKPPSTWWNRLLQKICRADPLPQTVLGTSVMGIFKNKA